MMLAAVNRSFGRDRRPRGRRVASGGSRRSQTTTVVGMGSEGRDGVVTPLFRGWFGLRKRGGLAGVQAATLGKQSRERKGNDGVPGFIAHPGARGIDTQRACSASAKPKAAEGEPGRSEKVCRRWGGDLDTVHENYRIDTEFNLQITHKYYKEVENLQK